MPRLPIDYSKTVIYKIVHQDDYDNANVYVGHTTDFIKRKYGHKSYCNKINSKGYNEKKYQYIRQNGGWEAFKMVELEKYPCKDEREASAREEYWRDDFKATLNTKKCLTTPEEIAEQKKIYYSENKEVILEYQKIYRENNLEKILEYGKKWYENNKIKVLEIMKERIICEYCGCNSTKNNLQRHQKSKKCQAYQK